MTVHKLYNRSPTPLAGTKESKASILRSSNKKERKKISTNNTHARLFLSLSLCAKSGGNPLARRLIPLCSSLSIREPAVSARGGNCYPTTRHQTAVKTIGRRKGKK